MESETWRAEVNRMMTALAVVNNNGPSSVGGGGAPQAPLAPPDVTAVGGFPIGPPDASRDRGARAS